VNTPDLVDRALRDRPRVVRIEVPTALVVADLDIDGVWIGAALLLPLPAIPRNDTRKPGLFVLRFDRLV
jgi:hypothetical protein